MNLNGDLLTIVASFLHPVELARASRVNRLFGQSIHTYLSQRFQGPFRLETHSCPLCGHWKSTENLTDYREFFDLTRFESEERFRLLHQSLFCGRPTQRTALLCSDCEYEEAEYLSPEHIRFPFEGSRTLHVAVSPEFTVLYEEQSDVIVWNEFRVRWIKWV